MTKINQRGFSKVAAVAVLAITVVGVLYFLGRYTELSIFNRKVGPDLPSTAGWQTYRNEQYGFEVRYPEDWIFQTRNVQGDVLIEFTGLKKGWPPPQTDARPPVVLRLTSSNPSLNWQSQFFNEYKSVSYKLGSISGTKISGINKVSLGPELAVIAKVSNTYLEAVPNDYGEESLRQFDQILATFKFIR